MTVIVVKAGVMTTPPSDSSEACVRGAALWLTGSLQVFAGNYLIWFDFTISSIQHLQCKNLILLFTRVYLQWGFFASLKFNIMTFISVCSFLLTIDGRSAMMSYGWTHLCGFLEYCSFLFFFFNVIRLQSRITLYRHGGRMTTMSSCRRTSLIYIRMTGMTNLLHFLQHISGVCCTLNENK